METVFNNRLRQSEVAEHSPNSEHFSPEQIEVLRSECDSKCSVCGVDERKDEADDLGDKELIPHIIVPIDKGGKMETDNATMLCEDCHQIVEELAKNPPQEKRKLNKITKKKLWKIKGRTCQGCGLEAGGGPLVTVHPFRPADWSGEVGGLSVLCPRCLGGAARKRDKMLELAQKARAESKG